MRSNIVWVWLTVLLLGAGARAQIVEFGANREVVARVDGMWRFHPGDDPRWADPAFDDSGWPLLRGDRSWSEQGYAGLGGFAWYRFTATGVPPGGTALLVPRLMTDYEVFADGIKVGGYGRMPTRPGGRGSMQYVPLHLIPLPASVADRRAVHVAIRVWHDPILAPYVGGGISQAGMLFGAPETLGRRLLLWDYAQRTLAVEPYVMGLLYGLTGLAVLTIFFLLHGREREYLWFALLLLLQAADAVLTVLLMLYRISVTSKDWWESFLNGAVQITALLFFSTVLRVRRGPMWWAAVVTACVQPWVPLMYHFGLPVAYSSATQALLALPTALWVLAVLFQRTVRGDGDARLLVLPAALSYGMSLIDELMWAHLQLSHAGFANAVGNIPVISWPFAVRLATLTDLLFLLGLMAFLIRRFALVRAREERFGAELQAAREVQRLLLPARPPATPGFDVEAAYLPALEVGGDFWQVLPGSDGSLLVVVGDVSGKGLQAAMTVSAIVGALRGQQERQPAEMLQHLNRVLCGQISGFATCCAVRLEPDGTGVVANAGHLPPYANDGELEVEGGLPLGLADGVHYAERRFTVQAGESLLFVSDGVVEAKGPRGVMFGFERTAEISRERAGYIAETARAFGQNDDITVIAVRWLGRRDGPLRETDRMVVRESGPAAGAIG